jgi:AcrR family transcriptional regulator
MPRTEEANQRIRETQRAKILGAALSVFARGGMEASIAEVAIAADVSYGLVYRYFPSKDALLVELVETVLSESLKTLAQALEMPGTPGGRLRSLLTQIVQNVREHPEFILLVQQMLSKEGAGDHLHESGQKPSQVYQHSGQQGLQNEAPYNHLHRLALEQRRTYRTVLKQLVVEGQTTGEIAGDDPDQLVAAISAYVAGLSHSAIWQAPEEFQHSFPDVSILFRMFVSREKEKMNA